MKKTIFILLGIMLVVVFSKHFYSIPKERLEQHQSGWEVLTEKKELHTSAFSRIYFFDKNNGVAQTDFEIKKTVDGGISWTNLPDFGGKAFSTLLFTDNQSGWVTGINTKNKPFILKSKDKGVKWEEIKFDTKSKNEIEKKFTTFHDVCFTTSGKGWIVGDAGIIEVVTNPHQWELTKVYLSNETLYSVNCNDASGIWAVGNNGTVVHYQNKWDKQKVGNTFTFLKVKVIKNSIWLLGFSREVLTQSEKETATKGVLLRSTDNGQTWENKTPNSAENLNDIYFDNKNGWLVGGKGNIYSTNDGGDSWIKEKSPSENNLLSIFFLDSNNIWLSGNSATILKYQK